MTVKSFSIQLSTRGDTDIHDITDQVAAQVSHSGLKHGTVTIFCPSSTSALTTIEYESGAVSDLKRLFEEIVPQNREYAHNARWGDGNGHSHVRASLIGRSIALPVTDGRMPRGPWQQVISMEHDTRARQRQLSVTLLGE